MDIAAERSYPTPFAKSAILPLLLLSLTSQKHTPKTTVNINTEYDYIIVGGGTAGSVVANRLSELPCVNVLLLEAGKDPPLLTEVPALSRFFRFSDIDWNYKTVPQKHTGEALMNKEIPLANGKTLGGSSVLNSVIATRGSRSDYDNWAANSAVGWSYKDLIPYFKKLEDNKDIEYIKNGFHSVGGLQSIQRPRYQPGTKKSIFQAARSMGFKVVDPNAWRQTGFYDFQAPLRGGVRCSTAKAYLVPAENRTNLHILSRSMVRKVIINDGDATGVLYDHDGETYEVTARKEVILSAGTFNTAKLLMLSGVGPKKELNKFKIPVLADLPVGKNLQDHCAVPLNFLINSSIPGVLQKMVNPINVDRYIKTKSGALASPDFITALGFVNSHEDGSRSNAASYQIRISEETTLIPKLQYGFKQEVYSQVYGKFESKPYITCLSQTLNPSSRGTVKLHSNDPYDPPLIDPNFMEDPKDVKDIVEGLKICRKLAATPPMQKLRTTAFGTLYPGCEECRRNEELYLRCLTKQVAISMNNPVGTAKMGDPRDPTTVVDTELRVKYVRRLRVIDASIMPTIISGDTSIPTIMIAEKGSDIIKSSIDCEDDVAESDVQASVPVISISTEILEKLPNFLKKPAQRRDDTDSTLEKLKEALGLSKNTKQFHTRSENRVQSQVKEPSRMFQDSIFSRRQEDPSTITMNEVVKCLEELQQQIKNTKQRETTSNVIYSSSTGNDRTVGQIMSALNGIRQSSNIQNNNRNTESNNEVSPALMNQISSLLERLRGDREVSETSSGGSLMTINNEASSTDAANQISSLLNVLRGGMPVGTADLSRGNSQNDMVNQLITAIRGIAQESQPPRNGNFPAAITDSTRGNNELDAVSQLITTIRGMAQESQPQQNRNSPTTTTGSNRGSNENDMVDQLITTIREMAQASQPPQDGNSPTGTTRSNRGNDEYDIYYDIVNQLLTTIQGVAQESQPPQNGNSPTGTTDLNRGSNENDMVNRLITTIQGITQESQPPRNGNSPTETTTLNRGNNENDMANQIITTIRGMARESQPPRNGNSPTGTTTLNRGNNENDMVNQILTTIRGMAQEPQPPRNGNFQTGTTNLNRGNNENDMVNQLITTIRGMTQEPGPLLNGNSPSVITNLNGGGNNENDMVNQIISTIREVSQSGQPQNTNTPSATNANQQNVEQLMSQIMSSINDIRQIEDATRVLQNRNNSTETTQNMMNQILSAVNGIRNESRQMENESTTPPSTTENLPETMLQQILSTLNVIKQNNQGSRQWRNSTNSVNVNKENSNDEVLKQIFSAIKDIKDSSTLNELKQNNHSPRQWQDSINLSNANSDNSKDEVLKQIFSAIKDMKDSSTSNERRKNNQRQTQWQDSTLTNANRDNSNDEVLKQIFSAIKDMKEDIRSTNNNNQTNSGSGDSGGTTAIQDSNSRYLQQILNQQMNQNSQGSAPLIQTVVVQEIPDAASQINRPNPVLGPIGQPPINGMQFLPQGLPLNPILNLQQRQRNLQILSALTGGNGLGINPPLPLPPQLLGLPPAVLANLQRMPPPFMNRFPPFIPNQMPCQKTIVLNNLNICNGNGMLQRPITENEIKLCQSLQSATQCQPGNNCRAIHPYLYNHYCGKK